MTEMRTLPVDEALRWITAWTEHPWPITRETAFAIRDHFGWRPHPQNGRLFATHLSETGREDGRIGCFDDAESGDTVSDVKLPLTSIVFKGQEDENTAPVTQAAFNTYVQAVTNRYGKGQHKTLRMGGRIVKWTLPNRVTLTLSTQPGIISATIDSPRITAVAEMENYLIEKYGEDEYFKD
ncbi:hypothetical protein MANAM107_07640 [Actinomyces capricornis]|uniref:Uncharacterized protein n=2 Tax=Actinomyces capricornis TaxID=2755559 RepID=A0ABM7U8Z3_9ACTO|nr:hypothetical protein MANAM107_07640 [Actinomyces capricornis]